MTYEPAPIYAAGTIVGNPTSELSNPSGMTPSSPLNLTTTQLSASPVSGRVTTGNVTIAITDDRTTMQTTDATAVTYTLPTGITGGVKVRVLQGGAGAITYAAGSGATG